jgi:hypothetical protein
MIMRNSGLKYFIIALVLITAFSSCVKKNQMDGSGVLKGKISIGPLCPVETDPPLPGCLPTMETYKAWLTAVWTVNQKLKLATLNPKLDGTYEIGLPAGEYIVDFDNRQTNKIGGSNLPALITVTDRDTTKYNINIDTGIR